MDPESIATPRAEIDERQSFVATLLANVGADQLLLLSPPNIAWFTGSPLTRGILDPAEQPCLIVSPTARWLVCSKVDSQRLFDLFLDGLGFQLKEWPWHQSRDQLLTDLCQNRTFAIDQRKDYGIAQSNELQIARMRLSPLAAQSLTTLGHDLAHALEATCRNIEAGQPEQEIAGHLGHRLLHRGLEPVLIQVAGDGRLAKDLRPWFTSARVEKSCTVMAHVQRDGLYAAAARTVWFGPPDEQFRADNEIAGPIAAARVGHLAAGTTIHDVLDAGQKVAAVLGAEHAWRDSPAGWFTGRLPIEYALVPQSQQPLESGHALTFQTRIGAAYYLDTYLIGEGRTQAITAPEDWPARRYRLPDRIIDLPDILVRIDHESHEKHETNQNRN